MKRVLFFLLLVIPFFVGCNSYATTPTPASNATPSARNLSSPEPSSSARASSPISGASPGQTTPSGSLTPTVQPDITQTPETVLPRALLPVGTSWELYGADSGVDESIPVSFDPTRGPWIFASGPTTGLGRFEVVAKQSAPSPDLFPEANYIIKAEGYLYSMFYFYRVTQQEMDFYGTASDREESASKRYSPPEKIADWSGLSEWKNTMTVLSGDQAVGESVSEVKVMAQGRVTVPYGEFDGTVLRYQTSENTMGISRTRTEYRWLAKVGGNLVWAAAISSRYNDTKDPFSQAQSFTRLKTLELAR